MYKKNGQTIHTEIEFLDAVDHNDEVIGRHPKEEIYERKLFHRIVHVLIYNSKGEMALQLRSKTKSFCPLHWSTAVGGHVQAGETYEQGALREFKEELGLVTDITFMRKDLYTDGRGLQKFLSTFHAVCDGGFTLSEEEVERVEYFSLPAITQMIKKNELFHPELLFLVNKIK